jgi:hypothetical protein
VAGLNGIQQEGFLMENTKYAILNRTSLEGFLRGTFAKLDTLWFADLSHGYATWETEIDQARIFETEEEAWEYVTHIWGKTFAQGSFLVVAIPPPIDLEAHYMDAYDPEPRAE